MPVGVNPGGPLPALPSRLLPAGPDGLVRRSSSLRVESPRGGEKNARRVSFSPATDLPAQTSELLDSAEAAAAADKIYRRTVNLGRLDWAERRARRRRWILIGLGALACLLVVVGVAHLRARPHPPPGADYNDAYADVHLGRRSFYLAANGTSLSDLPRLLAYEPPLPPSFSALRRRAELFVQKPSDALVTITAAQIGLELSRNWVSIASLGLPDPEPLPGATTDPFEDPSFPTDLAQFRPFPDPEIDPPRPGLRLIAEGMTTGAADNSAALMAGVEQCRRAGWETGSGCMLAVPAPGTYRFGDATLVFAGMQDFELDGQGATFLFGRKQSHSPLFQVDTCTRCRFFDFVVDWDWSISRLASVVHLSSSSPTSWLLTFPEFPEGQPPDPASLHGWISMHSLDQDRWSMGARDMVDGWYGLPERISAVRTEGGAIRLDFASPVDPVPPAELYYLMRHWSYEVPGFWLSRCSHCTIEQVRMHGCPGKALVATDGSHSLRITRSRFSLPEQPVPHKSDRFISMTVDGLFFGKVHGGVLIEDTEVGWNGDDCLNVHNPLGVGVRYAEWDTAVVGKAPAWKIVFGEGDLVSFRRPDFSEFGFEAKVVSAWQSSGEEWTIKLDRALPDFTNVDRSRLLVVNHRWTASNVVIRNFHCHDNRARGLLLQVPNVLVERSLFSNIQMSAVRITASAMWGEGLPSRNVMLRNNTFRACDRMNAGRGVVWTSLEWDESGAVSDYQGHTDVVLLENRFEGMPGRAATLQSARGLSVRGNVIVNGGPDAPERPDRGQVLVAGSSQVELRDNEWVGGWNAGWRAAAMGGERVGGARNVVRR
ncbi:pectin lyase fold/virulence factor [Hyaloraphidium curvatum]|nr:pectin lyase fold/virulence factor [Hyaloraphidium curvatum]